ITAGIIALFILFIVNFSAVEAQTTSFTYQGKITDSGAPANGNYDLQFSLFDALTGGTQQGTTLTLTNISVTNGIFSVSLDFNFCLSGCFSGGARFLQIAVRPTGNPTFTTLNPRQQITSTPYTIRSLNAASADSLSVVCVNCITSN